jgi:hypothetical protein
MRGTSEGADMRTVGICCPVAEDTDIPVDELDVGSSTGVFWYEARWAWCTRKGVQTSVERSKAYDG